MQKVTLSLDSTLKEIFSYEESCAVFDRFLPGMRARYERQPHPRPTAARCTMRTARRRSIGVTAGN